MIPLTVCGGHFQPGITLFDQNRQRSNGDYGILGTDGDKELIWYSKNGVRVQRSISCAQVPLDAVICDFIVTSTAESHKTSAIAILLTEDLLQLHLFNGETFDIHLPVPMSMICSSSEGLLLQRKLDPSEYHSTTSALHISQSRFSDDNIYMDNSFDVKSWLDETNDEERQHENLDHEVQQNYLLSTYFICEIGEFTIAANLYL